MMLSIGGWPVLLLFALCVLLPACISVLLWRIRPQQLRLLLWSQLGFSALFFCSCWVISQNQVVMSNDALTLQAGWYHTSMKPMSASNTLVSVVSAGDLGQFQPTQAVNGIHLPHYQVGWFRLANQELAFVMLIGDVAEVSIVRAAGSVALVGGNLHQTNAAW